ncbi:hypothetical protein PCANC_17403 [Puccinia coronata f. sp. avenae]|uniref:SprT-like domain-containing protein n=1 Tax=Puccinia coronata f. sp. avenae TaxID=200324 RepID=A0A2N5SCH7_9BASI|nr:hypothetical protein PCANC_17403 [Puccinia coronata f. sp. avenae]
MAQHDEHDRIEVAASRALALISSSAHARSQPVTPTTETNHNSPENKNKNKNKKDDILDIFMSPDKPKSRLRQLAENSAKKFNTNNSSLTLGGGRETENHPTEHFVLNLGIPSKPAPDPKPLTQYKPPTRRSIGPRRSSIIHKKQPSPTKSPKPDIQVLLDDLDILDRSRSSKSPFDLKKKSPHSVPPKSRSNPPKKPSTTTSQTKASPVATKSRHIPSPDDSTDEDLKPDIPHSSQTPSETHDEVDASLEDDIKPIPEDESDDSTDSFDPKVLLVDTETTTVEEEEEEEKEESIILNPTRPSTRKRPGVTPKRVIQDSSDEEEEHDDDRSRFSSNSFSAKSPKPSSHINKGSAPRRSLRKSSLSLRASHSKQKSPSSSIHRIVGVDDSQSDDSIEIAPSRALQFQKLRSKALTTNSYSTSCDPLGEPGSKNHAHCNDVPTLTHLRRVAIPSDDGSSSDDVEIQINPTNPRPKTSSPKPTKAVSENNKPKAPAGPNSGRRRLISSDDSSSSDDDDKEEERVQITPKDSRLTSSPQPVKVMSENDKPKTHVGLIHRRRYVISSDESSADDAKAPIKPRYSLPKSSSPRPTKVMSENDKPKVQAGPHNRRIQVYSSDESPSDDQKVQTKRRDSRPKSSPKPAKVTAETNKPKAKAGGGTSKTSVPQPKKEPAQPKKETAQPKKETAQPKKGATQPKKATGGKKKAVPQDGSVPFAEIREELARELVLEMNKRIFGRQLPPIEVFWSKRLNSTAGRAHFAYSHDKAGNRVANYRVELALKVVDCVARLRNTLAHELCHVACWAIDQRLRENHGRFFQAWGRKVHAAMPDIIVTTRHSYEISYKFKWSCNRTDCSRVYGRHSDSIKPERQRCLCGGGLVAVLRNGKAVSIPAPAPASPASGTTPGSDIELLIDLDSPGSCTDTADPRRHPRASDQSPSPSKSIPSNPYLSELEDLDPAPFFHAGHGLPAPLDSPLPPLLNPADPLATDLLADQFNALHVLPTS